MSKKTTIKPISLGYRAVGLTDSTAYTPFMGVLKGLAISQDEPDVSSIDAEFYDSPFDESYTYKPIKITFDLVNFDLSEIEDLFGGTHTSATNLTEETFEAPATMSSAEKEWKLSFQKGNQAIIIYRGKIVATMKKDADGAFGYACTITSLVYTDAGSVDHLYKIIGDPKTT